MDKLPARRRPVRTAAVAAAIAAAAIAAAVAHRCAGHLLHQNFFEVCSGDRRRDRRRRDRRRRRRQRLGSAGARRGHGPLAEPTGRIKLHYPIEGGMLEGAPLAGGHEHRAPADAASSSSSTTTTTTSASSASSSSSSSSSAPSYPSPAASERTSRRLAEASEQDGLRVCVDSRERIIEQQQLWPSIERACQREPLLLAAAECDTPFPDLRLEAAWEGGEV